MEALRIEFDLVGEVVLSGLPLHLDALVGYAVTEERLRNGETGEQNIRSLSSDLPLVRRERGDQWSWAASALQRGDVRTHGVRGWIRTTNTNEMAQDDGKVLQVAKPPYKPFQCIVNTGSGAERNYQVHTPTQQITTMTAWCIGDGEALESLLRPEAGLVTHIGKFRRNNHGRILALRIIPDAAAEKHWMRRILPWEEPGMVPIDAVANPPYWEISRKQIAWCWPDIF